MKSGDLKELVLSEVSKANLSGYSIIKQIRERSGWNPSTGSIYPLLKSLLREGLVNVRREGRKRVYSITADGRSMLLELEKASKFKWLTDEMMAVRKNVLEIVERDVGGKEKERIKALLRDCVQKIKVDK